MAKHLKVKAELIKPDLRMVKVTILEQSHFNEEFASEGWIYKKRFTYSKLTLVSNYQRPGTHGFTSRFNVAGSLYGLTNYPSTTVTLEQWKKIKKAIEAYNKKFAD